jgi:hypothetical protein
MIPIDRENPELAKRTLDEAAAKFGKAVSVVIFPEGTRAPAGQMLPLKGGAFVFAIQQQVPVVPVALHNAAQVMPAHGYLTIVGGRVVVEVLDPIQTAGLGFEDRQHLKERVRRALVDALRPEDGGVADRGDLGSFAGYAFGVHAPDKRGRSRRHWLPLLTVTVTNVSKDQAIVSQPREARPEGCPPRAHRARPPGS